MIEHDLKYSLRTLTKTPAMTLTAIAALALGIGANTALFSVVNAVLLRPLSYPHPERIVELLRHYPGQDVWAVTPTKFDFWRRENHSFEAVAAFNLGPTGLNLVGVGDPQRLTGLLVSADFFRVLGVKPLLGRSFTAAEDKPGAGHFAVIGYSFWQRLFHRDPKVLGRSLTLSDANYEIVGVLPKSFEYAQHPDLWTPLQLKIDPADLANDYSVIARLKPGVSLARASQDMRIVARRFRNVYGSNLIGNDESIAVIRYHDYLVGDIKRPLWILLAAVGFVLLIACANVANLLLSRSAARRNEMAIRLAIGATGKQLVRQLLTESLLLSMIGAGCGILIANIVLPVLLRLAPADIPQLADATIDARVLICAALVAIFTGILFGLFPALQSARLGIANPLREAATRTTANAASNRIRQSLVIAEVAISLVLLIGATLLIRTIGNLEGVLPGFDPRNVLTTQMSLTGSRYSQSAAVARLTDRIVTRLEAMPGIVSVATASQLPLSGMFDLPFEIVGHPTTRDNMPDERYRFVSPHYFSTLKIPVVSGRAFSARDTAQARPVLIVNQAFARTYFPRQNPLGRQILIGRIMGPNFADRPRQIVGVVGDTRDRGLGEDAPPEMFEPAAQVPDGVMENDNSLIPLNWVIRTTRDPMSLAEPIRRETLAVSGGVPMAEPKPLEALVSGSIARERFMMTLLSIFAGLALLLGSIGLYGVIAYSVAQRTREMGIRSALGARRSDLLKLVVGQGMRLTAAGLLLGLLGAWAVTRFLQGMLYGVTPSDPSVLLSVTALMALVALAACLIPARRAARIDPLVALRDD